ncbi:MAG: pyridoxamine 5'-phosphate oxidase family protein, partial [Deltaproteobacteria bacterium]|nr:pyridoxamine 5'-phosphate oxidase family protein [Deltaproteobacteria bacterium]
MKSFEKFDTQDMKEFEPEAKVGLIATISPEGLPHITLITALQAKSPSQVIWAQFS